MYNKIKDLRKLRHEGEITGKVLTGQACGVYGFTSLKSTAKLTLCQEPRRALLGFYAPWGSAAGRP